MIKNLRIWQLQKKMILKFIKTKQNKASKYFLGIWFLFYVDPSLSSLHPPLSSHMGTLVEVRGQLHVSSSATVHLVVWARFSQCPETHWFGLAGWPVSLGNQHLCLCSSGVTRVCHHAQGLNSGLHAFAALTMLTAWSTSPASLVLEIKPLNLSVWGMVMGVRDTLALTQRRLKQPHSCLTWARCLLSPLRFGLFIFKRNNIYNFSDNMSRRINAIKKVALYNLCQL